MPAFMVNMVMYSFWPRTIMLHAYREYAPGKCGLLIRRLRTSHYIVIENSIAYKK